MGRLRTAVRTLADIDLEPEELLTRLDDVVTRLAEEDMPSPDGAVPDLSATCLYAVYDPVSRRCSMARAGHLLPALVSPDGTAEFLDLPAGPPLGLGGLPFEEAEFQLPEGSLLVLYTDGLIESRQRDIDTGLDALRKVLSEVHVQSGGPPHAVPSLDTVCDSLVDALLPDQAGDDAAVLVARTCALPPDRIVSWNLPADPAIVAEARAAAARQLAAWGLQDLTDSTELLVSELVTNAIRHAQPPIQLRLTQDSVLSCEVSDGSSTSPHLRRADRYDEGGRGLMLVAQFAERWGTRHTRSGKTIWAEQSLPRSAGAPRLRASRHYGRNQASSCRLAQLPSVRACPGVTEAPGSVRHSRVPTLYRVDPACCRQSWRRLPSQRAAVAAPRPRAVRHRPLPLRSRAPAAVHCCRAAPPPQSASTTAVPAAPAAAHEPISALLSVPRRRPLTARCAAHR
jgi:anti-sigma regulatory factor (Ser/Thr protein kinase)